MFEFEPHKPLKLTKEQIRLLIDQTKMFKDYFANLESSIKTGRNCLQFWPIMKFTNIGEHFDAALEQATINKNYFSMLEMYLGMVEMNIDMWHATFINP